MTTAIFFVLGAIIILLGYVIKSLIKELSDATEFILRLEDRLQEYREEIDDIRHGIRK